MYLLKITPMKTLFVFLFLLQIFSASKFIAKPNKWKVEKSKSISFPNSNTYKAEMLSRRKDEFAKEFKLSIMRLDNSKKPIIIWESAPMEGEFFEDVHVLESESSVTIAGTFNLGGAHALFNYVVMSLFPDGNVVEFTNLYQYGYIDRVGNELHLNDVFQKFVFTTNGNEIKTTHYSRDQMGPADAITAHFSISGNRIMANNPVMNLRFRQSIAFIPANERTKTAFNSGDITIYTDAWSYEQWEVNTSDWHDYSMCEATTLHSGNSYTFEKRGTFHFILCDNCDNVTSPTITVHVK
jgi:hypothetical protein